MKIPCVIDLDIYGAKEFVNRAIKAYGKSRDYNNLAMTVNCEDELGNSFAIVQFYNNRRAVHFMSA